MTTSFYGSTGGNPGHLMKELTEELKKLNRHLEKQLRNQPQFQSANSPQGTTVPTANDGSRNTPGGQAPDPYAQHQAQQSTVANAGVPEPPDAGEPAKKGGLMSKVGKGAFNMSGGFLGIGMMAFSFLPMLMGQGAQKTEEMNQSLSAFGAQAIKTSEDISRAFTNFANIQARTGSSMAEQLALTSNFRSGGSMKPQTHPTPVSYTHLTLPTILLV